MIEEYKNQNLFWESLQHFLEADPHLLFLKGLVFVHPLDWWQQIDWQKPGIYILTGGRQLGKTTSTKLLIKNRLMNQDFQPADIFYLPCDPIPGHQELLRTLRLFLQEEPHRASRFLLILDEVTYVKEWDRAVKTLADEGWFRRGFCLITGSDSIVLKEAMQRFPGRRGEAAKTDFQLKPLCFREYVTLVEPGLLQKNSSNEFLLKRFHEYFSTGGHLRAINDFHRHGAILPATYTVFEQWIRGDCEKRGKSARILTSVLKGIMETLQSQVTYSALAQRVGEITKETFIQYCDLLERLDVMFVLQAFDQNKRIGFPKKAKKIHFWDPFIFDTVQRWLVREGLMVADSRNDESIKAEAAVASHFKAQYPTYYVKRKGEIDVLVIKEEEDLALEVKWTHHVRPWDVEELQKFSSARILSKTLEEGQIESIPILPLPRFLVAL